MDRLHRGGLNGGDVGRAQSSLDYDVDSNPEGWTERLRVGGLRELWASSRWIHHGLRIFKMPVVSWFFFTKGLLAEGIT